MKFTCEKNILVAAVGAAVRSVATKVETPVLSGMSLVAEDGKLTVSATDYEIGTVATIAADVKENGMAVVPGKFFNETIRALPGPKISFELSNGTVKLKSEKSTFTLLVLGNGEDFPKVEKARGENKFTVESNVLKEMIRRTAFACAVDETRPVFTGVSLTVNASELALAATNSHRLSLCSQKLDGAARNFSGIVPKRVIEEVLRVAPDGVTVDVVCSGNEISFAFDGENGKYLFVSRLISGQYPDVNRAIPKSETAVAEVNVAEFLPALQRVALIARSSEFNTVKLLFSKAELQISSANATVGKAVETVGVTYQGEPADMKISFNASYLADAFKAVSGFTALFRLGGELKPAVIVDPDYEGFIHVVTPVRSKD